MKFVLAFLILLSSNAFADIADGNYTLKKMICTNGKILELGNNNYVNYAITLDVIGDTMIMTANVQMAEWIPGKISCVQINRGKFSYISANSFEGDLLFESAKCNIAKVEKLVAIKKKGTEEFGVSNYEVNGNELKITTLNTKNTYSCPKGEVPTLFYYKN